MLKVIIPKHPEEGLRMLIIDAEEIIHQLTHICDLYWLGMAQNPGFLMFES